MGRHAASIAPSPAAPERQTLPALRHARRRQRRTAPADAPAAAASGRSQPTRALIQRTGTAVTTTTTERPVGTAPTTADRRDAREAYRGYPDHAVVNMTKDQLKALPEVRYAR